METPNKICLIYTGEIDSEIVWCDSVPSHDINGDDVVWYGKQTEIDRLTKENERLTDRVNGDYPVLSRHLKELDDVNEALKAEVIDHQFQNDCRSGSEVCACSEKNGYPCYRHIDHEYRKLFSLNTAVIDRAEKAEAERDRLRETDISQGSGDLRVVRVDGDPLGREMPTSFVIASECSTVTYEAINHKEG